MGGKRHRARVLAFQMLYAWDAAGSGCLENLFTFDWAEEPRKPPLEEETKNFARLLTAGTIEHAAEIDSKLRSCLKNWELDRVSKVELAALRLGSYGLLYHQDESPAITINECVQVVKEFTYEQEDSYKFVNGVLDAVAKNGG